MALMHKFNDWHKCVSRMTKEAKKSTASHYILYTGKGNDKPSYLLCSAEDEVKSLLVESLDNGRVIHRVGQTSQLTGKRMFAWPDSLPRGVVWAIVPQRKSTVVTIENELRPLLKLYYYQYGLVLLEKGKDGTCDIRCNLGREHSRKTLKSALDSQQAGSADAKGEVINGILRTGAFFEHRWFGRIDVSQWQGKPFTDKRTYYQFDFHDIVLGDTEFNN